MSKTSTKKTRIIREKNQEESSDSNGMITVKQLKEILQENYVVYKSEDKSIKLTSLGMDSKNNIFIIKTNLQEIRTDSDTMKTRLIEVRYKSYKSEYSEYSHDYEYETSYDVIGLYNNINTAWNQILKRVEKYHTRFENYGFKLIEVNQSINDISHGEQNTLNDYNQEQRRIERELLNSLTLGFKCSECKYVLKGVNDYSQTTHAKTHQVGNSWGHVVWTRIMKKEVDK